jgi:hypothetical protein
MVGRVIAIAVQLAAIGLIYPVMLIVAFEVAHAIHCTLNASWR